VASSNTGTILWVRSLSSVDVRAIPGTEGARNPFWSPDSQSVGYFADGALKTVRVTAGSPVTLCQVGVTNSGLGQFGTWSGDVILFSSTGHGIRQVSTTGGTPAPATIVEKPGESQRYPFFLPNGQHFLYIASGTRHELRVGSLTSREFESLGTSESHAAYANGGQIAFNSNRPDPDTSRWALFTRASNGSGQDVQISADAANLTSPDWSVANVIVYNQVMAGSSDLRTRSMTGEPTSASFLGTKADEIHAVFSRDGRWIAYQSNASGQSEIYVRPYPGGEPMHPVSRTGGMYPGWSGDGTELFFLSPDGSMMVSRSETVAGFAAAVPQRLFGTPIRTGNNHPYAVTGDGRRFLIPIATNPPLRVILDWRAMRR
jgi:hypothetical protein